MILLKDIFTLLATGEFSNIALTKDKYDDLDESEYGKVIGHINLALVEIYKRFPIREEEVTLHATTDKEMYYLRPKHAAVLSRLNSNAYIEVPEGHDGYINIIEIKEVYGSDGVRIKLNNRYLTPHVRQMSEDTLKITGLTAADTFSILYQAHPSPIILDDDLNVANYMLNIPKTIVEALLYYVASRVYKPMGANNSTANADKSTGYQQQFELSCARLELLGLGIVTDIDDDPEKFERDGWA
jgi:hypothetical protein